jgi:hypothetical protein
MGKQKKHIPLSLLGVHKQNRGGVYPTADTVQNLALKLLAVGFSPDEANHEGVCVQEVPTDERRNEPLDNEKPYESHSRYNRRQCDGHVLSKCFGPDIDIMYGTLSHSHLLLVLLCYLRGAKLKMPEKWKHLLDSDGCLNVAAVAEMDTALATLCKDGLYMEVLSWKMYVEEPTACSLISQALNTGQQMALHTTELTAMAVLTGAVAFELQSAVAEEVAFESVKEKVRGELDMFVDLPEFLDLFEFVINMGGNKSSFIPHLLDFGSKFVDQKQRQLRLQTFAEVNKLPLECPRSKVAMIMRAYRKAPLRGQCPNPEAAWSKLPRSVNMRIMIVLSFAFIGC